MVERDDIIECYRATESLKGTAKECGVSYQVVRRVLASEGIYTSEITEEINRRYCKGDSLEEIAATMHMSVKAVMMHLPYSRNSYAVDEKTDNAKRIAEWRKTKQSTESAVQK